MEKHNKRDKDHLINLISNRNNTTPNFALLIGAGASARSGIKTASQMIDEWRRQLHKQSRRRYKYQTWLEHQDWYGEEDEYSTLFEMVYDQPAQRRVYIEECVKDAKLCWGYIYLANIIANNYFNVVFTPNFDDLLNEACFLYADLRPMVCAHDSVVADIRITSARPKLIKLHGDFLYDSMKNTVRETETLEKNMRDKFIQLCREYGLVVTGYGGNDRSIMDILEMMTESEVYLPHGLYWCRRKDDTASKKLERLMRRDNVYWVEVGGFDEFMAELHDGLMLTLPTVVRDPYKATTERLNTFISVREDIKHPIIMDDIKELEDQVRQFEQVLSREASEEEFDRLVPYSFLGDREYYEKEYENALNYYEKALIQNADDLRIMDKMIMAYWWTEQFEEALKISESLIHCSPNWYGGYFRKASTMIHLNQVKDAIPIYNKALKFTKERSLERATVLTSISNTYLINGEWEKALKASEKCLETHPTYRLANASGNMAIALKKLNRADEAEQILKNILKEEEDKYLRAAAYATLGDKNNMLKELTAAIKEDSAHYRVEAKTDPDFEDYREDPDFRKLVYKK